MPYPLAWKRSLGGALRLGVQAELGMCAGIGLQEDMAAEAHQEGPKWQKVALVMFGQKDVSVCSEYREGPRGGAPPGFAY